MRGSASRCVYSVRRALSDPARRAVPPQSDLSLALGALNLKALISVRASISKEERRAKEAERGGFEPPEPLDGVHRFSKPAPSATRPSLRNCNCHECTRLETGAAGSLARERPSGSFQTRSARVRRPIGDGRGGMGERRDGRPPPSVPSRWRKIADAPSRRRI